MALAVKEVMPVPIVIGTFLSLLSVPVRVRSASMVIPAVFSNLKCRGFPIVSPAKPVFCAVVPLNS